MTRRFAAVLRRIAGKGGWTYVSIPKKLAPPITRAWGRTPVRATMDGIEWDTSVWRSKTGEGLLRVAIAFSYEDD